MQPILIDICGTLFRSNTTYDFVYFLTRSPRVRFAQRISKIRFLMLPIYAIYRLSGVDLIRNSILSHLKGYTREQLQQASRDFYDSVLEHKKIDSVWTIIQQQDAPIVLISGTIDCVATEVAHRLNAIAAISSPLAYNGNICQGCLASDALRNKRELVNALTFERYSLIITDNYADNALFDLADRQTVVLHTASKRWRKFNNITYIYNF